MRDFRNDVFAAALVLGPDRPPVTERMIFPDGRPSGNDYTEKDHMCCWFLNQETAGHGEYLRARPNTSARVTYGRLLSAAGLLWIGESLGAPEYRVGAAARAAAARAPAATRCRDIRSALPWSLVAQLTGERLQAQAAAAAAAKRYMRRAWHLPPL